MTDAINLSTAILSPSDVRDWPITTAIVSLTADGDGLHVQLSPAPNWPDIKPAGWDGPIYLTVWLGTALGDGVHMAASLNVFSGQSGSGAGDVTNLTIRPDPSRAQGQYANNLWYLDGALGQHAASEGETLYLMVTAGGWRGIQTLSVPERSNVVAFQASSAPRKFTYAAAPPVVPPVSPPNLPPDPVSPPSPVPDVITAILAQLARIEAKVTPPPGGWVNPDYTGSVTIPFLGTGKITVTPAKK